MKKSLIALAALAATSAFAQSSVTLYGRAEAGVDLGYKETITSSTSTQGVLLGVGGAVTTTGGATLRNPTGSPTATTAIAPNSVYKPGFRVQDGNSQGQGTSRIGFRGTEDLGGGLKANFVMEMGVRIDQGCVNGGADCSSGGSGGSQLFGRAAWAGLSGGFGEVRLGRQVLGSFGVHANGIAGAASSGLYEPGANIVQGGVRFNNAIQYRSPDFGGISGTISLAAPESTGVQTFNTAAGVNQDVTERKNKTGVDLSVAYANGPIYVGFGYNRTGSSNSFTNNEAGLAFAANTGDTKITDYAISASYNFGVAQPFFSYVNRKNSTSATGVSTVGGVQVATFGALSTLGQSASTNLVGGTNAFGAAGDNAKSRQYTLGVKVPVGPATLIAAYGNMKTTGSSSTTSAAAVVVTNAVEAKTRAFQIGAQYPLSKRTTLQANYGINNTKFATAEASGIVAPTTFNLTGTQGEVKVRGLNFGVAHAF